MKKYRKRYEWKQYQLWDNMYQCWVIWEAISGKVGISTDFKKHIAKLLNEYEAKRLSKMSTTDAMCLKRCM